MNSIDRISMEQIKKNIPVFKAGDTLRVHVKITEGDKQRIQVYQGVCIKRVNRGLGSDLRRAQDFQRLWRRADLLPPLPGGRQDRGDDGRAGASCQALLPA